MRRILTATIAFLALAPLAPGAEASHPAFTCVDIEPDSASPSSPGGETERLTAYVGTNDDDHEEPAEEGCVITEGDDFGNTNIDFEVIGAGDPDESDSPDTPDMTCTVASGSNSCRIVPPETTGDQTIDAWLDNDRYDSTTELDFDEGQDEGAEPGAPEPDGTDVALWRWVHGDPCGEFGECQNESLTISYSRRKGTFKGRIEAGDGCISGRRIKLHRVRAGEDPMIGKTNTAPSGQWQIKDERDRGRYYAIAPSTDDGCKRQRSATIRV